MYVATYVKNIIYDVLKLKNQYNWKPQFYCKNDICTSINNFYSTYFVDIPDINGNSTSCITYTCIYENIDSNKCNDICDVNGIDYSCQCSYDTECLSNKCYKNHCVFNNETPIVHCSDSYSDKLFLGKSSYIYCGKPPNNPCEQGDECSSKLCMHNKCESVQDYGPSDSNGVQTGIEGSIIFAGIFIIIITLIIIIICCYCCKRRRNNRNQSNNT
ncbi:hypothetical protein BCR36DRAFT_412741 [Piromyces finnis]|uniref:Uncharacterized protein n=1 Tax=Piromyces finnis TaxID=1754191 RepID=A0A1Y1V893_9FUNG|nr:hypothetical protein BCR36DRAFT_412741 [Piromyces finnis]|eukprot:ORX49221.1 hypothetical protein BCR36DRAFT_412741 [Piromyces finnis]